MRGPARSGGQAPVRRERAWMTAYCHSDHSLCRVDGERCRVTLSLSRLRASQLTVSVRQSKMSCASRFQPFISRGRRVRGRANESPCDRLAEISLLGPTVPQTVLIGRVPHAPALLLLYCLTPALHPRARSHHRALLGIASLSCQQRSARQPQDHAQDTDLDRQCKRYFNLQARGAGARLDGDFLRPGL